MTEEATKEELLDAIDEVNHLLVKCMEHAETYNTHDEVRPSAIRALDNAQEAHMKLTEAHPHWELPSEDEL